MTDIVMPFLPMTRYRLEAVLDIESLEGHCELGIEVTNATDTPFAVAYAAAVTGTGEMRFKAEFSLPDFQEPVQVRVVGRGRMSYRVLRQSVTMVGGRNGDETAADRGRA